MPCPALATSAMERAGLGKEGWAVNTVEKVKQWVRPVFFLSMCRDKGSCNIFFFLFIE